MLPPDLSSLVREGDIIAGKYRVESVLGAGGMGVVVAARHIQLEERVALKFLLPTALSNPESVERFAREARAAVKIKSEHVARVIDVGELESGAPYIVMEYLEGGDLEGWLTERGPLRVDQAVEFILHACVAVADAHALGIIHRDLKPANLFCVKRSDGRLSIKVLDFGISKATGSSAQGPVVTHTAAVMGTPVYMAPEQIRSSKSATAQSDIWALGATLYELLAGKPPFDADTMMELAVRVTNDPTPSLLPLRPEVSPTLDAVVKKCLEKDPEARYRNVAALAVALLPFAPDEARGSVDRIAGIIGTAGLSRTSSDRPPSLRADVPVTAASSPLSFRPTVEAARATRGLRGGALLAALVSCVVVGAVAVWQLRSTQSKGPTAVDSPPPSVSEAPPGQASAVPTPRHVAPPATGTAVASAAPSTSLQPPAKKPPTIGSGRKPAPCTLVTSVDRNGESHFSCPCATCE